MATTADRVLGEALRLAPDERARIVAELLASLEPDVPSDRRTEAEWIDEIERRARAAKRSRSTGGSRHEGRLRSAHGHSHAGPEGERDGLRERRGQTWRD